MFSISRYSKIIRAQSYLRVTRKLIATCIFALIVVSADWAFGLPNTGCLSANPLEVEKPNEIHHIQGNDYTVSRLDIPTPGVLSFVVFPPAVGPTVPSLEFLGRSCFVEEPGALTYIERSPARFLVRVNEPGVYFVALRTPPASSGDFTLMATLAQSQSLDGIHAMLDAEPQNINEGCEDPGDDETLFSLATHQPPACLALTTSTLEIRNSGTETATLTILQPGVLEIGRNVLLEVGPGKHNLGFEPPDDKGSSLSEAVRFYSICGPSGPDGHGKNFACATQVDLGDQVPGEIDAFSVTDRDVFTFTLDQESTVVLETTGGTDTLGRLFDRMGSLVAMDDDSGEAMNFRIGEPLAPGQYFLSVESATASEGSYVLTTGYTAAGEGEGGRL